jgi:hypothetical protein
MRDLGVTLLDLVIVGLLVASTIAWNRLRFARDPLSFRCRLARPHTLEDESPRWSRWKTRAKWAGTVLVVQAGPLWARTLSIPVHLPLDARIQEEGCGRWRRLGAHPQSLRIEEQDGSALIVAVRQRDRTLLVGPFLAAAVAGLPAAPRSGRRRKL